MKCPICNGKGKTTEYDGLRKFWCDYKCDVCDGKGVVEPMTEQEYIQSCNTEQLAKVLLSFCQYPCEICKIECDDGNACTYNKALNTIVEWLKQPHKDTK